MIFPGAHLSLPCGQVRRAIWKAQGYSLALITFTSFFPSWSHLQEYFFFGMFALALATAWSEGRRPWVRTAIDVPLGLFIGWVLLTIPFATDLAYSFAEWRKFCAHVLVFYWALLVLRANPDGDMNMRIRWAVVVGAGVLSVYALTDFVERGGTWRDRFVRAGAPSSDYNWLTTYMIIALPVSIAAFATCRRAWLRGVAGLVTILVFLGQVFAYTRAGWLALFAEGLAYGAFARFRRFLLWTGASAAVLGFVLVALSQVGYQRDTLDPWTLDARIAVWKIGIDEVLKHPVVGVGYGNDTFLKRHPEYSPQAQRELNVKEAVLPAMHNTFLMVTLGSGLPGLACFVWLFARATRSVIAGGRVALGRPAHIFALAVAVMVVGFAVRNFFDYMFAGSLASLFWILVATGLSVVDKDSTTEPTQPASSS